MTRIGISRIGLSVLAFGVLLSTAQATTVQTVAGTSSVGQPVSLQASLTISGDFLTVVLSNVSTTAGPTAPNDLLSSYYFDIVSLGGQRPGLAYMSAAGDVWHTYKIAPDVLQAAGANLKALAANDNTWQFKAMNAASNPFLGFGIGTVGNSSLANSFNGNVVGGMDYSIYAGQVTTQNLDDRLLVKDSATFTFSGASGFTEADIAPRFAFGLGTAPDSLLTGDSGPPPGPQTDAPVPEPLTMVLTALALAGVGGYLYRHKRLLA